VSTATGLWAESPGKRAVERFWLAYTPVWGGVCALVMVGGFAERWGDAALLALGLVLALGAVVGPFLVRPAEERGRPLVETTAFKMVLGVVLLSFGLNYTQTPYFWDVLHMHFGFGATWTIDSNPIFLYLLTVAYFSTYSVLTCIAFRWLRARLVVAPAPLRLSAYALAPLAMALGETVLNANPWTRRLFCYDDMRLMLWFGTLSYGVAFVLILPAWMAVDERRGARVPALTVALWTLAALYADLIVLDLLRYHVAPALTTVHPHAHGLRDFGSSCLGPR
jgi:cycloeucalenol cycloisomerase